MTTEEAKKAGFRIDAKGYTNAWVLFVDGTIRHGYVQHVYNLVHNDFPTREKAREALRKRKLEAATKREDARVAARKAAGTQVPPTAPSETPAAQAALDKAKLSRYERQHPYMDDAQYAACVEARDWDGADLRVDALDKAKAEAEPLEWCEREDGDLIQPDSGDDISIDGGKTWKPQWKSGVIFDTVKGDLRARYRNPLWLAKHGNDVESHETPVGETQAKEVVTDETQPKPSCDAVSHPSHYTSHPSGVECITITKHMNFCRGNAVKYLWRAGQKGDSIEKEIEDIAKAEEYCRIEKERLIALKGAK